MLRACSILGLLIAAGCTPPHLQEDPSFLPEFEPEYGTVQTRLLDGDLVNFLVDMRGARGPDDVSAFAECAAAQYTLIRGYGFARHVRTTVEEEGGIWRADAVYTVSPTLPRGLKTIDAEVKVGACTEQGIPTV